MMIDPTEQIQSISEFRTKTDKILKSLGTLGEILLTQYGKTRAILMDPKAYEEQIERLRLAEKILRGKREIEAGLGVSHSEVEKLSKGWL
ncbi:MAG: type II toxin-antitoxin system Phd/YefM family antitoxin [Deltaproteobacteria bacterium]|nr:type II toxin-antitoxin system Phd/YefM family antitoxin [Deltaproteobacteria bacterium]